MDISTTLDACSTYPAFLNATGGYEVVNSGAGLYAPLFLIAAIVSFLLA